MTATKNFRVDSFVSGLAIKAPVAVATTIAVSLAGEQTVNGVGLIVGDRCLVKDQADPIENGIYNVETSAWQRAGDMDGNRDIVGGTVVPAYRASDGLFVYWIIAGTPDGLDPGVDALTFSVFFDPSVVGASLPVSLGVSSTLRSDGIGGWVEETEARISATGGLTLEGSLSLSDGTENLSQSTSAGVMTMVGTGGFSHIFNNVRNEFGDPFYMIERAAATFDQVGMGQFWVRNDDPNTPMFTSDTGVDYELNASAVVAAPIVLLDDEEIQFGTGTDATISWDSTANALILEAAAANSPIEIRNAQILRIRTQLGTGYVDIQNTGPTNFNVIEITKVGSASNFIYDVGPWNHSDHQLIRPTLADYSIGHITAGSSSGVLDIDFEDGNSHFLELDENVTTMTLSNPPTSRLGQVEIEILQDSPARTIAWPASVQWPGGTAPDLTTTNATYLVHLRTRDGGTTYLGTFAENFS